ncbi:MAG: hypothetical protein IIU28_07285 [Lachnospiraceae bacterium]|nr:hypothetical protein [Lachnospiraceae bacterium]
MMTQRKKRSRFRRRGRYRDLRWAVVKVLLITGFLTLLLAGIYIGISTRRPLVYTTHLDDVAVTVDGEDLTLEDMAYYVVYEEMNVEKQARIYDPKHPIRYWNTHANGVFVAPEARRIAMEMAIHDRILLRMAQKDGVVLSTEEKEHLEQRTTDFWEDLYDEQKENLPVSYNRIDRAIRQLALVQKYQYELARKNGRTYAGYNWDGAFYEKIYAKHKVKIHKLVWNRVNMGNVSLRHKADFTPAKRWGGS